MERRLIDVDKKVLENNAHKLSPILSDYLSKRKNPLMIELYSGSIDMEHSCLNGADAVIGIEIIEHLYPNTLDNLPYNLFHKIKPKLIIFTTPNIEFNVNFELKNQLRHDDHKFEWTRDEFQDWGNNLCLRYPDYKVKYYGIGVGINDQKYPNVGCVSQMAVFIRKNLKNINKDHQLISNDSNYKLLEQIDYPYNVDNSDIEEKIIDEIKFHIRRFLTMDADYLNYKTKTFCIPIKDLYQFIDNYFKEIHQLSEFLIKHNYKVIHNKILILKDST